MMSNSNEIYRSRINKVIDYVNDNLDRSISLDELASVAAFSPFHFHRIFVAVTGESVNFFTNRIRLEKAARLLKFSKQSIFEIALECGFSSSPTLSRAFKQYFEISPRTYRKEGNLENSKIRKELVPLDEYLCPMSDEALRASFPVQIKELPERRIAYIRVVDSYREGLVISAFDALVSWAKKVDVFDAGTIFGMSLDDPKVTPKEKYRYEACITIPKDFKVQAPHIETTVLPKCNYAIVTATGNFNFVATGIHYLFNRWLIQSVYEPAHQHGLEIFRDKDNVCNWDHFDLDLCLPVQSLNHY
jgi:AraC family transcriptional regulator